MNVSMKPLREYTIQFVGLKLGKHHFDYQIDNKFFEYFEYEEFNDVDVKVDLLFEKKEIKETLAVKNDMRLMISKSDNAAATRMIDRVGYHRIEKVMTNPKYALYDKKQGGGLWVGKRYGSGGTTNREPLKNLSHAATVNQVCKFYYLLAMSNCNRQRIFY